MSRFHDRIRQRLAQTRKSMRRASLDSGLSEYAVSTMLRTPEHSQTLETIAKLAVGLESTPEWLAYGVAPGLPPQGHVTVSEDLLRQAVSFLLVHEGVSVERASLLSEILPEALSGPPVDAVEQDPFLSFRVHLQLGGQRSANPKQQ